jgi:hypothetical protein
MTQHFKPSEWATVLPRTHGGIFASPYLEPASIVAQETGSDLAECLGCGQLRERVSAVLDGDAPVDVCSDCRQEHGV